MCPCGGHAVSHVLSNMKGNKVDGFSPCVVTCRFCLCVCVWSHVDSASVCVWSYIFLSLEVSADYVVHPKYFILSEYRPPSQSITTARTLTPSPLII